MKADMGLLRAMATRLAAAATACFLADGVLTESVEVGRDFVIYHDFKQFKVKRLTKVCFYTDRVYEGDDPDKRKQLLDQSRLLLAHIFSLVESKGDSEYTVRVRMGEYINY